MRLRLGVLMISLCLALSACGGEGGGSPAEQLALDVRGRMLEAAAGFARVSVTADYGRRVYEYGVDMTWQAEGETVLTLTVPENVAGVSARILEGETALESDGTRVETGALDDSGVSPLSGLPLMLEYARTGWMAECGMEELDGSQVLRIDCRDPENSPGEGRACALWFDPDTHVLLRGELSQDGFTVLRCEFTSFEMQQP